jgi:hypothetical protein
MGLYALVTAKAQPDRIMELTDRLLRFKRKGGQGLVDALTEL